MKGGEDQAAIRRIKKLEKKVETMATSVLQLFKKYDE